jgi:hypothetical protein
MDNVQNCDSYINIPSSQTYEPDSMFQDILAKFSSEDYGSKTAVLPKMMTTIRSISVSTLLVFGKICPYKAGTVIREGRVFGPYFTVLGLDYNVGHVLVIDRKMTLDL